VKRFFLLAGGGACLVLGVSLVFVWWPDVVALFKGGLGMGLALAGLIILATAK